MEEKKKILIVDEEGLIGLELQDILTRYGYSTQFVHTGEEALKIMQTEDKPELVLMEIILQDRDIGIETADKIQKEFGIPVVYLTSQSQKEVMDKALKIMPYGYLVKDIDNTSLYPAIETALARKDLETRLEEKANEADVRIKEAHHRTKNNMQVVKSFLGLAKNDVTDKKALEVLNDSVERLKVMSLVQEILYQSDDLENINLGDYLSKITTNLHRSYAKDPSKIRLEMEIQKDVSMNAKIAGPCGLILNEVMTNSFKYAFPDEREGELYVSMNAKEGEIELIIGDTGVGLPEDFDLKKSKSLGMRMIDALTNQLKASLEINRDKGTEYRLKFNYSK